MACNNQSTDCAPCKDCQDPVPPVLPRCESIVLPAGTYNNATLVVNDEGCIIQILAGEPFAYQPMNCCTTEGDGGGGEDGLPGPPGPPGQNATISIGTVTTTAPGTPATVTNVGTPTNAILNYTIPRGEPGEDGDTSTGLNLAVGEWEFVNGILQSVPGDFPPIGTLMDGGSDTAGVSVNVVKDPVTGVTTIAVNLGAYATLVNSSLTALQDQITAQQDTITTMQGQIAALQTQINACCPP